MSQMQDHKSSLSDASSRKFETFSYLPAMAPPRVRKQVEYIVGKGWKPAIEHTEPENLFDHFWCMWKLPLFGETVVDAILAEADACHRAHLHDYSRLVGYDNSKQTQGAAMVIYRGQAV